MSSPSRKRKAAAEPQDSPAASPAAPGKRGPAPSPHAGPQVFTSCDYAGVTSFAALSERCAPRMKDGTGRLLIMSLNLNGLRSFVTKVGALAWLAQEGPDVVCLQETRIDASLVAGLRHAIPGYSFAAFSCAVKKGYAGTAILVRESPTLRVVAVGHTLGSTDPAVIEAEKEGRITTVLLDNNGHCDVIVNAYVPNSGRDRGRLDFRTRQFDPAFQSYVSALAGDGAARLLQPYPAAAQKLGGGAGGGVNALSQLMKTAQPAAAAAAAPTLAAASASSPPPHVFVIGDLNVCHQDMDISHPARQRNKVAGFCDGERDGFARLLAAGFRDVFRERHPTQQCFTYRNAPSKAAPGVSKGGYRLDYALAYGAAGDRIDVECRMNYPLNDHFPLLVTLAPHNCA